MTGTVIDGSNHRRLKVQKGDYLLNSLDEPIAEVVSVGEWGARRGVVTVKTRLHGAEIEYELGHGKNAYEWLIEFQHRRFLRPDPPSAS